MAKQYDLIVIGSGVASSGALACRQAGWEVAVIDDQPFGGTCALRGCDPKKVLVGVTEYIKGIQHLKGSGISGNVEIDWKELMQFKESFTEDVPEMTEKNYHDQGIDTYQGRARFTGKDTIQVNDETLAGKHFLIATGASPVSLPIEGKQYLKSSDDFLNLEELPEKIIFVGGGYISFEFAHVARRSGADVQILHRSDQPLKEFDKDLVDQLTEYSIKDGIQVELNTDVQEIKQTGTGYVVIGEQNGETKEFVADMVFHGAGRGPNIEALGLEKANVAASKKGIEVNEFLQSTTNPNVYAAGDVAASGGRPLTPVAGMESEIVSANLLQGNHRTSGGYVMPSIAFTLPKLASVGLSEQEADEKGMDYETNEIDMTSWYAYKRTNQPIASAKLIIDKEKNHLLGAHLLSGDADELINHFATAIQFKLPIAKLKEMLYGYPTSASNISSML